MRSLKRTATMIIAGTCILSSLSGCSKKPDAELAAAKAALQAAKDAGAEIYMSKNYQNIQKALENAELEIAKQDSKFVLSRKYKRATELLTKTASLANEIAGEAPKIKEAAISQVKENLGLVDGMLKETANDIKKCARQKDKAVIEELKADLANAEAAAARASSEFNGGDAIKASESLNEVQALIKKITDTLKPPKEADM
ncbi:MAG TPA: hypothetical protein VHO70_22140 [Chitinispirillaceae bacterium]|nr:hypothetical protein [Chitinispirillaceae bacterium]